MSEKRAHPRFETRVVADLDTGKGKIKVSAKDLSMGGVGLELDRSLDERISVAMSLFLAEEGEEGESIDLAGQVVWTGPNDQGGFRGGVRFSPLQPEQAEKLRTYLERLERKK